MTPAPPPRTQDIAAARAGIPPECRAYLNKALVAIDLLFFTDKTKKTLRPEFAGANFRHIYRAWNLGCGHGLLAWEVAQRTGDAVETRRVCLLWWGAVKAALQAAQEETRPETHEDGPQVLTCSPP